MITDRRPQLRCGDAHFCSRQRGLSCMLCCRCPSRMSRKRGLHQLSVAVLHKCRLLLQAEGCSRCHPSSSSQMLLRRTQRRATLQPFKRAWAP